MAIYGAGSMWSDETGDHEKKGDFFKESIFKIGWEYDDAQDLCIALSELKVGDIIYLKANAPGNRSIRVKGIGIVRKTVFELMTEHKTDLIHPCVKVQWITKKDFTINIDEGDGKLTNIRPATLYEESLPSVQTQIIDTLVKGLTMTKETPI
ncbi:MAG: hypothetical protein LKK08_06070 [Bacteroidales bacterium]|jgi:hypothetical protein|nr:hypothetical protein [Bacteroidales bacterium]